MQIAEIDKQEILQTTKGLLPSHFLRYCNTDDRKKHFAIVTNYYQILTEYLARFWSGTPINEAREKYQLSEEAHEHFTAVRSDLIELYTLIYDAWDQIVHGLPNIGLDGIKSPSQLIQAIIVTTQA